MRKTLENCQTPPDHGWYTSGDYDWYTLPGYAWYSLARLMTDDSGQLHLPSAAESSVFRWSSGSRSEILAEATIETVD